MEERNHNCIEPWDRDSYETGSTRPPKSHGGLIAVLLVLVILLCGVSSALGVLNIKLGIQLKKQTENAEVSFSAAGEPSVEPSQSEDPDPSVPPATGGAVLELNPSPEGVDNVPQSGGLSYQQIYEKTIDSVVSISCTLNGGSSSGTGVILSSDGYIVTNSHVVEGAKSIQVRLTDDRVLSASVVGADAVSDLAVLYVKATDLQGAQFGDSTALRVGDAVAAIGDPLGSEFRGTMTDGIVSAINRDVTIDGRVMTLIQTNAALNSGNSGGPLLNCYGQVIGINTMKISAFVDEAGVEGLGFAIPSTTVRDIVNQLISQGYVSGRPSLGLTGQAVSALEQRFYHLPAGFLITQVEQDSNADRTGLAAGDIILSINGQQVTDEDGVNAVLYSLNAGDTVELVIYRNYKQYSAKLVLEEDK